GVGTGRFVGGRHCIARFGAARAGVGQALCGGTGPGTPAVPRAFFPIGRSSPACRREAHMHRYAAISASLLLLATGVAAAQTPTQPSPARPNGAAQAPCAPS